jgi:hypothetical protein
VNLCRRYARTFPLLKCETERVVAGRAVRAFWHFAQPDLSPRGKRLRAQPTPTPAAAASVPQ